MDGPSLCSADDAASDALSLSTSHPAPPSGGVLVLDKHIVYTSLHRPLLKHLRKDTLAFALVLTLLVINALPALWYEAQASWIRSGEVVDEAAEEIAEAVAPTLAIGGNETLASNLTDAVVANVTKPLTEVQLQIAALHTPDTYHFWFMYLLPLYCFLSAIMWLVLYWNVKLQILFRYRNYSAIQAVQTGQATHVRVVPVEHGGKSEICPIERSSATASVKETFFVFQKTKYLLHEPVSTSDTVPKGHVGHWFAPIDFPTHLNLQSYIDRASSPASGSPAEVEKLQSKYGENVFDIPLPPFMDLFKEHALAPFFVFQIFCVGLWCLDEYWYYSIVTLFMLVLFEATVVKRRLKNLEFLREMRIKPYPVQVWRGGKWTPVLTSALVPHDLISLVRPANEQNVIPADILLLTGNVVVNEAMLTGESVPVQKENLAMSNDRMDTPLELNKTHKRNMVFGGTKILLANPPASKEENPLADTVKSPPDGGCIGYVIRTGFNTSQGKLVRTILFSSETVSINNLESLAFIGVLLIFAIAASAYVCMKGLEDESKSRYKLMLNCIMILTSVVPPELPMELSLAVNTSLLALMKNHIFCTEPFRIPLAGAVDICCFDKTGTLTADEFIVKGISGVKPTDGSASSSAASSAAAATNTTTSADGLISQQAHVPVASKYVIAGCHSLAFLPESAVKKDDSAGSSSGPYNPADSIIGDPLEKSALGFIEWNIGRAETASSKAGRERLRLLHKYPFSSALKRMSAVVALEHEPGAPLRVVTKGAAEVMQHMFAPATMPAEFTRIHTEYAQQGCRVLALGWKDLPLRDLPDDRKQLKSLKRDDVESGLTFGGFLVLQCPLKKDSREVILQLKASTHQVMMISGDAPLTCLSVAMDTGITTKTALILQTPANGGEGLEWQRNSLLDDSKQPFSFDFTEASLRVLSDKYDLCVTGDALEVLVTRIFSGAHSKAEKAVATSKIALFVAQIRVFARASPDQKELILHWLKSRGFTTLMCGDGTNDTGALKQAHIGVALIGEDAAKLTAKKLAAGAVVAKPAAPAKPLSTLQQIKAIQQSVAAGPGTPAEKQAKMKAELAAHMKKMEAEMGGEENTTPRLGDASIASPFTSKLPFITSCVDIIRQGRCTLVTTLQMFNILGVNCLISAYSMSVLYLDGVKWGDTQMTIASLSIAMFFLFISRSQPLKQLSAERPHKNLFTVSMILSVLGQFAIHMVVLLAAIQSATPFTPNTAEHKSPEKTFKPNVLNTVVYLVSTTQTVATFAANYRGRPFMESLSENTALFKSLAFTFGLMMVLASELVPQMNTFLELHELPSDEFRQELILLLLADVAVTYFYARLIRRIFAIKPTQEQIRAAGGAAASSLKDAEAAAKAIEAQLKKHQ